ncbi:MAG: hypothetical protein KY445_11370 [Armatimonadetes bacterium]|nr:hypothetical protein [Armatimonadota bacterium]
MPSLLFRSLFLLGSALGASPLARAQETPQTATRPLTQREFADAASTELGFLASLRAWRETLRGGGAAPRRDFSGATIFGEQITVSLGRVDAPTLRNGTGLAARWNGLEVGTTAQPEALSEAIARFDSLMLGAKVAVPDQTEMTWLRARPVQSQDAEVELSLARGQRDMRAGEGEEWRAGTFAGARARFNLPAKWSLRGDVTRAQIEDQNAAISWGMDAAGPVSHPFGVARARLGWRDVDAGFATLSDSRGAIGGSNGALEIVQDVALGPVAGSLKLGAEERQSGATPATGQETEAQRARSEAQMRLKVTPNLSLRAGGQWQMDTTTRVASVLDDEEVPSPAARDWAQQTGGDVGVEWKFSPALSLSVSAGASRRQALAAGETPNQGAATEEERRAVEVRHRAGDADFRVRLAQRARRDDLSVSGAPISQWRVEAAHPLVGGMRLKTILDVADDAQNGQNAHSIEAQLQLARAARFDARYRQGNLPQGLLSSEWKSAFNTPQSATQQWAARFNAGSAAGGTGLGLALEYARSAGSNPDSWRVGVQIK